MYENEPVDDGQQTKVADLLASLSVEEVLRRDEAASAAQERSLSWFHGSLSRIDTDALLKSGKCKAGSFLVRNSSSGPPNRCLSFLAEDACHVEHFKINFVPPCLYRMDNGPLFHGLDELIRHYQTSKGGLPIGIAMPVIGQSLPAMTRKFGRNNALHRAVCEGNSTVVGKMLSFVDLCPDIDAKDGKGLTALHTACEMGLESTVIHLIKRKADVASRDSHGLTPLHRACAGNWPAIVLALVVQGNASTQDRCHVDGWVPLHVAAHRGHVECVQMLLALGAPSKPRDDQNRTPNEVASSASQDKCALCLDNYKPPPSVTSRRDWYHPDLSRQAASELFEQHGKLAGLFLVRPKSQSPGSPILCMCHDSRVYNFEVNSSGSELLHIDDGPEFETLEHVIQHYCCFTDGLPHRLTHAIASGGTMKPVVLPPMNGAIAKANLLAIKGTCNSQPGPPAVNGSPLKPALPKGPRIKPTKELPVKNSQYKADTTVVENPKLLQMKIIKPKQIKLGSELGQGEYGSVLKGVWKNENGKKQNVAIKTLHEDHIQTGKEEFLREAKVMMGLDHVCIVRLVGICEGPPLMLVQELLSMGSLLDYLLDEGESVVIDDDLYLWAAQVACGMMYLENRGFVHRDLAARNILLLSKKQAKISDFGLSRAVGAGSDYYRATKGGRWPVKWYAPESVNYGTFSHASDVWSFGVTLWEMFTFGDLPYGDMNGAQVIAMIESGDRLARPNKCPAEVYDTMLHCWSYDVTKRPTFKSLNQHFTEDPIYADIQKHVKGR